MSELNPTFFPNDDMSPNQEWNTDLPPVDFHLVEPERPMIVEGEIPKTKARIEKRPTGRAAPTRPLVKSDDMGLFGFLLGGAALIGVGVFVGSKRK